MSREYISKMVKMFPMGNYAEKSTHRFCRYMCMNLFRQKGRTAKEIHADAAGIAFHHLQRHRVKLPIVQPTQEIGVACPRVRESSYGIISQNNLQTFTSY